MKVVNRYERNECELLALFSWNCKKNMNELSEALQNMSGLYLYANKSGSILHYCLAFQPGKGLQTEFDHKIDLICLFG